MSPLWTTQPQQPCTAASRYFGQRAPRPGSCKQRTQFTLRGITQDVTKHAHAIASLDEGTAAKVADLLATSSTADDNNKYAQLKQCLLECFQLSEQERARRLLELRGLGDRKPSELMEEVLALLQDEPFSFIIKELYLQQLPPVTPTTHRPGAARQHKLRDRPSPGLPPTPTGFGLPPASMHSQLPQQRSPASESPSAADEPQSDALEIDAIDHATRPYRRAHPPKPRAQASSSTLCYYHRTFGKSARKCSPTCSLAGNGQAGHQ